MFNTITRLVARFRRGQPVKCRCGFSPVEGRIQDARGRDRILYFCPNDACLLPLVPPKSSRAEALAEWAKANKANPPA